MYLFIYFCIVWVKKVAPSQKTSCNIFTRAKYISVKFVGNLYLHIFTNFGLFMCMFSNMALILL